MATVKGSRGTPSRRDQALVTRRRMMEAAHRVFSGRGYANTTMQALADEAGVAVQTVYFTFHTKADLLQAAYEYAVLGPDETPPHLTDWWRAAEAEPDIVKAIDLLVDGSVEVLERAASLVWAVRSDEAARAAYDFNENLRVDGFGILVAFLEEKHPLRPGLSTAKARDILLTLLGPYVFQALTAERGWSSREYSRWVKGAILRDLFGIDFVVTAGQLTDT